MAADNYAFKIVETGNLGSGPYTVTLFKNPTQPSGGTTLKAFSDPSGNNTQSLIELATQALHWMINDIAKDNQTDTNN